MQTYYDRVQGLWYLNFLAKLHEKLRPTTYLEIGSQNGYSFTLSQCKSIAIDPEYMINHNVIVNKSECHFYQCTSDRFFQNNNPKNILNDSVEFAFLDGMHLFEFLLRDFKNIEKYCKKNSVIAIHDCLPGELKIAVRDDNDPVRSEAHHKEWWTGDVWKILPVLTKYRPDLKIVSVDCAPTGLILITNLDPDNTLIEENYAKIVAEYVDKNTDQDFDEFWAAINLIPASSMETSEGIFRHFWL